MQAGSLVRTSAVALALFAAPACGDDGGGGGGDTGATTTTNGSTTTGAGGAAAECGPGPGVDPAAPAAAVSKVAAFGPRQETAVVELDGLVYVLGGFTLAGESDLVETYDPVGDTWSSRASLPRPLHHANVAAHGGKLYLLGFLESGAFLARGESFVYDPAQDQWSPISPMPMGTQRGASATATVGDRILVVGGFRGVGAVTDVSAYDPVADAWSELPSLPTGRDHGAAAVIGETFYLVAGRSGQIESQTSEVFALAPGASAWCAKASLPTARGGIAAAVKGGEIWVLGGEGNQGDPSGTFREVEVYDPETNQWRIETPLPEGRHGTGAATVGGAIIMPGGADQQAFGAIGSVVRID